jgi:hypothetical protein
MQQCRQLQRNATSATHAVCAVLLSNPSSFPSVEMDTLLSWDLHPLSICLFDDSSTGSTAGYPPGSTAGSPPGTAAGTFPGTTTGSPSPIGTTTAAPSAPTTEAPHVTTTPPARRHILQTTTDHPGATAGSPPGFTAGSTLHKLLLAISETESRDPRDTKAAATNLLNVCYSACKPASTSVLLALAAESTRADRQPGPEMFRNNFCTNPLLALLWQHANNSPRECSDSLVSIASSYIGVSACVMQSMLPAYLALCDSKTMQCERTVREAAAEEKACDPYAAGSPPGSTAGYPPGSTTGTFPGTAAGTFPSTTAGSPPPFGATTAAPTTAAPTTPAPTPARRHILQTTTEHPDTATGTSPGTTTGSTHGTTAGSTASCSSQCVAYITKAQTSDRCLDRMASIQEVLADTAHGTCSNSKLEQINAHLFCLSRLLDELHRRVTFLACSSFFSLPAAAFGIASSVRSDRRARAQLLNYKCPTTYNFVLDLPNAMQVLEGAWANQAASSQPAGRSCC